MIADNADGAADRQTYCCKLNVEAMAKLLLMMIVVDSRQLLFCWLQKIRRKNTRASESKVKAQSYTMKQEANNNKCRQY